MVDLNLHLLLNLINLISLELILAYLLTQKMFFGVHYSFFFKSHLILIVTQIVFTYKVTFNSKHKIIRNA